MRIRRIITVGALAIAVSAGSIVAGVSTSSAPKASAGYGYGIGPCSSPATIAGMSEPAGSNWQWTSQVCGSGYGPLWVKSGYWVVSSYYGYAIANVWLCGAAPYGSTFNNSKCPATAWKKSASYSYSSTKYGD